ncbi:MAG: response regulator [Oligoflexales bacterium]|nr:response regulator [Oligoflexales bacterium]
MERILLIVDEDKTNSELLHNMLKEGFYIKCSENLANSLDKISEVRPHVIIADLNVNKGQGSFEHIKTIKSNYETRVIPVIGLSSDKEDESKAYISGCDYFLTKPIDNFKLLDTLHKLAQKKLSVLVVDDDEDILDIIEEFLNKSFKVLRAHDGEDALIMYQNEMIHVIVTDIQMAKMDGVSLINKIRENDKTLPIIAISGVGASFLLSAMKVGSDNVIDKPFSDTDLKQAIKRVIIHHYPYKASW